MDEHLIHDLIYENLDEFGDDRIFIFDKVIFILNVLNPGQRKYSYDLVLPVLFAVIYDTYDEEEIPEGLEDYVEQYGKPELVKKYENIASRESPLQKIIAKFADRDILDKYRIKLKYGYMSLFFKNKKFDINSWIAFILNSKPDQHFSTQFPSLSQMGLNNICKNLNIEYNLNVIGRGAFGDVSQIFSRENGIHTIFDFFKKTDIFVKKEIVDIKNKNCVGNVAYKARNGVHLTFRNAINCKSLTEPFILLFLNTLPSNQSRYFVKTYAYEVCEEEKYILTFMEKIDMDLFTLLKSSIVSNDEFNDIIFQILYAFQIMHSYKINHNDPHMRNIFINVNNAGEEIECFGRIMRPSYLVKLGDFSLAIKYSEPAILNPVVQISYTCTPDYFAPVADLLIAFNEDWGLSEFYVKIRAYLANVPLKYQEFKTWINENYDSLRKSSNYPKLVDEAMQYTSEDFYKLENFRKIVYAVYKTTECDYNRDGILMDSRNM